MLVSMYFEPGELAHSYTPTTGEAQADFCELEASLGYTLSQAKVHSNTLPPKKKKE